MAFNGLMLIQNLVNQIGIVWYVIFCAAFCGAEQIFFFLHESKKA